MTRQKGVMKSLKLVGFSQTSFPIRTKLLSSQEFRDRRLGESCCKFKQPPVRLRRVTFGEPVCSLAL